MNNPKWYWVYVPYLDPPERQHETALKAGYDKVYFKSEADKVIAELKDKCQMHDFFWEGCGFAKHGFKNTIAVSNAFDNLEADNRKLKHMLWLMTAEWAEAMGLASCNIAIKLSFKERFFYNDEANRAKDVKKYRHRQVVFYRYADYCIKKAAVYK